MINEVDVNKVARAMVTNSGKGFVLSTAHRCEYDFELMRAELDDSDFSNHPSCVLEDINNAFSKLKELAIPDLDCYVFARREDGELEQLTYRVSEEAAQRFVANSKPTDTYEQFYVFKDITK